MVSSPSGQTRTAKPTGFTLVELLVVITIIFVLSGLLLAVGLPAITALIDSTIMQRRGEQVVAGLTQYQAPDGLDHSLAVINGGTGKNLRFGTLREVVQRLIAPPPNGCGLDLAVATRASLPPGLGSRYDAQKEAKRRNPTNSSNHPVYPIQDWYVAATGIDDVITFRNRLLTEDTDVAPGTGGLPEHPLTGQPGVALGVGGGWMADHYADVFDRPHTGDNSLFGKISLNNERRGGNTYTPWNARTSPIGETLDGTLEVMPDGTTAWPTATYYERWPNLIQIPVDMGAAVTPRYRYASTAWPTSDWVSGGIVPVVWPFPWGKKVLRRRGVLVEVDQVEGLTPQGDISDPGNGNATAWLDPNDPAGATVARLDAGGKLSPAYLTKARSADCLSPLTTLRLLAMAGILAPGAEGENDFRSGTSNRGRNRNQPWNDRWGQPLVLGFAAFIAPRYDFDDVNEMADYAVKSPSGGSITGNILPSISKLLLGGRDVLLKFAQNNYRHGWLGYLCVGSTGKPINGVSFGATWNDATDDQTQLIARWNTITTTCAAWEWHQAAFSAPPGAWTRSDPDGGKWKVDAWSRNGMRKGVRGNKQTCFLMSPVEVK